MRVNNENPNNNFGPLGNRNNNLADSSQREGARSRIAKLQDDLRGGQTRRPEQGNLFPGNGRDTATTLAMGEEGGGGKRPSPFIRPLPPSITYALGGGEDGRGNISPRPDQIPQEGLRPIDESKPLPFPSNTISPVPDLKIDLEKYFEEINSAPNFIRLPGFNPNAPIRIEANNLFRELFNPDLNPTEREAAEGNWEEFKERNPNYILILEPYSSGYGNE
jgi:hypothetical protein